MKPLHDIRSSRRAMIVAGALAALFAASTQATPAGAAIIAPTVHRTA